MRKYLKLLVLFIAFIFTFSLSSCNEEEDIVEESVDYSLYIGTYELSNAKLDGVDVSDMFESYIINLKTKRQYEEIIKYATTGTESFEEGIYSISNNKITFKLPYNGGYIIETYDIFDNQIYMYGTISDVEMEIILIKIA